MSYVLLPNIGQSLGFTRDIIRNNFVEIQNTFDVNHYDFDNSRDGKHQFVTLPNISNSVPTVTSPGALADEGALFTTNLNTSTPTTGLPELFYQPPVGYPNGFFEGLLQAQISGFVKVGGNGECPLFGGFSLKWGLITGVPASAVTPYKFVSSFGLHSFFSTLYGVLLTGTNTIISYGAINGGPTGFSVLNQTSTPGGEVFFLAIGF